MPFGITGLGGFAQQAPEEFPRFLQWQQDGTDLGDNAVETVNFTDNITATRGTGEDSNKLTVSVASDAGGTVTSVDLTAPVEFAVVGAPITDNGTLAITKIVQNANEVWAGPTTGADAQPAFRPLVDADLPVPSRQFTWRTPPAGSYTLVLGDAWNGVVLEGGVLTIPPHSSVAFEDGTSIVLLDVKYLDPFTIAGGAGVTLFFRDAFLAASAGRGATVTLIQQGIDNWVLCGDLEAA